jgi:DNA/RNA-binding domain of Phe-tRNA-synthetase-like protein
MTLVGVTTRIFTQLSQDELEELLQNPIIVDDGRADHVQQLWNTRSTAVNVVFENSDIVFVIHNALKDMGKIEK